ncbi:peptidylprolyl isomerase, partial [Candidatus Peregrinibacteria bacterium]|nr:peptidylprolyl isomerase [Candidatus Peregrinibacteria bacterium]
MRKFLSWKIISIILAAILLGFFNLGSESQKNILPATPEAVTKQKIRLGLDLQGGTQLDYKIDLRKVPEKDQAAIVEGVKEVINKRVNGLGVSEPNIYSSSIADEEHIIVELAGIKDIEEAKATVGKTIQLEFKEQRTEMDLNEKEKIHTQAESILQKLLTDKTADLTVIGEEEKLAYAGKVDYTVAENFKFQDELTGSIAEKAFQEDVTDGNIIQELIETTPADNEMGVNSLGQVSPRTGYSLYKVLKKQEVERKIDHEKEVKASHILISHQGAERVAESITRTEEEAKSRAEEVLAKIKAGGDFTTLATEYSDDPGSKEAGGDLGFFTENQMVKEFSSAAFAMTKDQISEPVKSPFGYHVIKVTDIKEASSETKVEPQVKLARLFYSTEPDPWKETELTGEHFVRADVQFDDFYNPYISIQFDEEGAKLFEEITGRNVQKPVAIFVGGELISAPNVQEKISGGKAQISGKFTLEEATNLARDLNTGAIPAPIVLSGQYTIGATFGQEALRKSLTAGAIGIIILALAMILYYRLPGIIAVIALSLYSFILIFLIKVALPIWAAAIIAGILFFVILMKIMKSTDSGWEKMIAFILDCFILFFITFLLSSPVVLTLAGIAGIILSIGMAVDANILIFERIKE